MKSIIFYNLHTYSSLPRVKYFFTGETVQNVICTSRLYKLTLNFDWTSICLIVQPILDLLYIHLFIELSWKSNISYQATCPNKNKED